MIQKEKIERDSKGKFIFGSQLRLTHGKSFTREYVIWRNIIQRCTNRNNPAFSRYGLKGITVCEKWKTFDGFFEDMGISNGLTIERIDNKKGYVKSNCKWATMKEQQNNRTNNMRIKFEGVSLTLTEWAKRKMIKRSTLAQRFYVYKWPIKKVLTA